MRPAFMCLLLLVCFGGDPWSGEKTSTEVAKPLRTGTTPGNEAVPIALSDGLLQIIFIRTVTDADELASISSSDGGRTWGEAVTLLKLEGRHWVARPLVTSDGEIQIAFLRWREKKKFLDVWHMRSTAHRTRWKAAERIFEGYVGSLRSLIQLSNGRILLPLHYRTDRTWAQRGQGPDDFLFKGKFNTTTLYSDDNGETWHGGSATLKVPAFSIPTNGGVEPVALELADGRIWLLIRSQRGRFYESFSRDGVMWEPPHPSRFISSDSPACLTRLRDGRIVLLWNACLRFPYALGGRHVLHAAISQDDGKTWRGFREIYRDPRRGEPPPKSGDHGTGYPAAVQTPEGKLLVTTGQGDSKAMLLLDPEWLYETRQRDDFFRGLESWSTFGTRGVEPQQHPLRADSRVLAIRKTERNWPAAAVWNFPAAKKGRIQIRILPRPGFAGASLALTDHFSVPFDEDAEAQSLYVLPLVVDDRDSGRLRAGTWTTVKLEWDFDASQCRVTLNGMNLTPLTQLRRLSEGVNYLRLRSTADETDSNGFLVEFVEAEIMN